MLTVTRKSQLALQSPIRLVCTRLQHCSSVPRWTRWSRWLTPFLRIFSRALDNIDLCPLTLLAFLRAFALGRELARNGLAHHYGLEPLSADGECFRGTRAHMKCATVAFTERSVAMEPALLVDKVRDSCGPRSHQGPLRSRLTPGYSL